MERFQAAVERDRVSAHQYSHPIQESMAARHWLPEQVCLRPFLHERHAQRRHDLHPHSMARARMIGHFLPVKCVNVTNAYNGKGERRVPQEFVLARVNAEAVCLLFRPNWTWWAVYN